jgi:hypothetical protein
MNIKFTIKSATFILLFLNFLFISAQGPNTRFVNPTGTTATFAKSFVKHLNSNPDEMFYSTGTSGSPEYFGTNLISPMNESRMISRLDIAGLPVWTAQFYPESSDLNINSKGDFACTDSNDNFYIIATTSSTASVFTDAAGSVTNFANPSGSAQKILFKIDSDGNKVWTKVFDNPSNASLRVSVTTDSVGDLYVVGDSQGSGMVFEGTNVQGTFISKISGTTGNLIYTKVFPNYNSYILSPVFDAADNLYIFSQPYNSSSITYDFDAVNISSNTFNSDLLMLKFDASGNCIFGKNFYETLPGGVFYESWIMDVVFDGTDFIAIGDYYTDAPNSNFLKLSGSTFPKYYPGSSLEAFISKISTSGVVVWEKSLSSLTSGQSVYTNINLDSNKNIYGYFNFKSDLHYEGVTYPFDNVLGDKAVIKFDNNGNLLYTDKVDKDFLSGNLIDVFAVDKYNVLGYSMQPNFLLYPITNSNSRKNYVATFGNLNGIYLRPISNFTEITNVSITNNPLPTVNEYEFNLLNNVLWNAESDQSWLSLSSTQLSGKMNPQNLINGNGDAKIKMSAAPNTSGVARTANVVISGAVVATKTVIVSQSAILAAGENSKISTIALYPNPTSDFLNIKSDQKISKVEIYDMSGKIIKSVKLQDYKIEVSTLIKGNYILKISTESGVVTSKFIKN